MDKVTHPSKEKLETYLQQRHNSRKPPSKPEEIRRELGWHMLSNNQSGTKLR